MMYNSLHAVPSAWQIGIMYACLLLTRKIPSPSVSFHCVASHVNPGAVFIVFKQVTFEDMNLKSCDGMDIGIMGFGRAALSTGIL